jgi:hypothetical protein
LTPSVRAVAQQNKPSSHFLFSTLSYSIIAQKQELFGGEDSFVLTTESIKLERELGCQFPNLDCIRGGGNTESIRYWRACNSCIVLCAEQVEGLADYLESSCFMLEEIL